jgi:two-component system C4-dicarboxylate transport response regulator DctD
MPRILVVEDDKDFLAALETMIRLEGYEVHLAADGDKGWLQALAKKRDIIVTDIDMPGVYGLDFVQRVRGEAALAHAYCILITGQGGQDSKLSALRAGADDFLEKPSSRQEILGRLEIAQKVLGVQQQLRAAEARAAKLAGVPTAVTAALTALDKAIADGQAAVAKKDVGGLVASIKAAKESAARIRAACGGTDAPAAEGSWL